jgi:hypothetical protein
MLKHPAYKGEAVAWRTRRPISASERRGADFSREEQRVIRPESEWIHLPDGVTPPLVTPDLWQRANEALAERHARLLQRNAARFYLLRGLVWCARCGRRMESNTENGRTRIYRCSSRNTIEGACGGARIPAEPVEAWVCERVAALITDPTATLAQLVGAGEDGEDGSTTMQSKCDPVATLRDERARAQRELDRLDHRQADLLQRYTSSDGALPWEVVEREVARLEGEKRRWRQTLAEVAARLAQRHTAEAQAVTAQQRLAQLRPILESLTPQQQRDVLESLDARIIGEGRAWRLHIAYPIEQAGEWVIGVEFTT